MFMPKRTTVGCLAIGVMIIIQLVRAQEAEQAAQPVSITAQVDKIFEKWDKPDSPGCVCAVMREGEVVYSRAFGMANLELDVPLTPQSVFDVGSVSKQFTAASIALLALRGQLSLDDDIRTYVPEMPDFGDTIRIRHLVHHTSGIRTARWLRWFTGRTWKDHENNAMVLARLSLDRKLNFRPGENFRYSNYAYILQAEIVKRVSGTSLREFAEENIFAPLGMANTQFRDDYSKIVKNRAQSYGQRAQGGLLRYEANQEDVGSSGLWSTAEDLLRWNRNFYDMKVGGSDFIELILTRGTLNDGEVFGYSFGLFHSEHKNLKMIYHNGTVWGFRTALLRFPEQRFSVAVICNLATITQNTLARRVADIYLRDDIETANAGDKSLPAHEAVSVSTGDLQKVTGRYLRTVRGRLWAWEEDDYLARRIYVEDDTLRYFRASESHEHNLAPLGNDRFFVLDTDREVIVNFTPPQPEQPRRMIVVIDGGKPSVFDAVEPVSPSPAELEGYLGTYFSKELDYEWVLRITNDGLSMWDPRTWNELALTPFTRDMFSSYGLLMFFTFSRDEQGKVVGFTVDTPRMRNLQFVRR